VPASGSNKAIAGDCIAPEPTAPMLVKFPPSKTTSRSSILKVHMVCIVASLVSTLEIAPLGIRASSCSLPFVLNGRSFCPSNSYNEMPEKSPAKATRPSCLKSKFAAGAGVNVIAPESDEKARTRKVGTIGRLCAAWRRRSGNRISC